MGQTLAKITVSQNKMATSSSGSGENDHMEETEQFKSSGIVLFHVISQLMFW